MRLILQRIILLTRTIEHKWRGFLLGATLHWCMLLHMLASGHFVSLMPFTRQHKSSYICFVLEQFWASPRIKMKPLPQNQILMDLIIWSLRDVKQPSFNSTSKTPSTLKFWFQTDLGYKHSQRHLSSNKGHILFFAMYSSSSAHLVSLSLVFDPVVNAIDAKCIKSHVCPQRRRHTTVSKRINMPANLR